MRRRGGWQARKWREFENRNWKIENGKTWRHGGWACRFCFLGRRKEFTTENAEKERPKSGKCAALDRKAPPLQTKGGAPSSSFDTWRNFHRRVQVEMPVPHKIFVLYLIYFANFLILQLLQFLLVFLVDVEDGAVFVEGYVEGFGFFYEYVGELIFLG